MNMKTGIMTLIMIMALAFTASAGDVDVLQMYDQNNDGIIDATERIVLDIDIEFGRLTLDEGFLGDQIAEGGSILLSDEVREDMTTGVHDQIIVTEPVVEEQRSPVNVNAPSEPESTPEPETNASFLPIVFVLGILGVAFLIAKRG